MIAEKVAKLFRGGTESDARLHLAVGDHPAPPLCAGMEPREVLVRTYPYWVTLLEPASTPLLGAVNSLMEQLAIRTLGESVTDAQKERLCRRCAGALITEGPVE